MGRRAKSAELLDLDLADMPPDARWREWMSRVEAVIFASPEPIGRAALSRVVGRDCNLDLIIDDIRAELAGRPYELVAVAGGWQHRTKTRFAETIRAAMGLGETLRSLSESENLVLMCIAYYQPITRGELGQFFGREVSRDLIGHLRSMGFIASGPRSPTPGAPYAYVTTASFLSHFGFDTLRDLPDREMLEDSGLLSKSNMLAAVAVGDSSIDEVEADGIGETIYD